MSSREDDLRVPSNKQTTRYVGRWKSPKVYVPFRKAKGRLVNSLGWVGIFVGLSVLGKWYWWWGSGKRTASKRDFLDMETNILPLLQAEEDRRSLRVKQALLEDELELFKDEPGYEPMGDEFRTRFFPATTHAFFDNNYHLAGMVDNNSEPSM